MNGNFELPFLAPGEDIGQEADPREGKDETNLCIFPFALLDSHRGSQTTLEFQDYIRGKNGDIVPRRWTVTSPEKYGLPRPCDEDLYIALMELTFRTGLAENQIYFSKKDLLDILGWTPGGKSYQRLREGFQRLQKVQIEARKAFWDQEAGEYVDRDFSLIQSVSWGEGQGTQNNWFKWNDELFESFRSGNIKFLDTELYWSLGTPTSRRLYRFLDRQFVWRDRVTIGILRLAHQHLGMSRTINKPHVIHNKLRASFDELTASGFLSQVWREGDCFIFVAGSRTVRRTIVADPNLERLVRIGLGHSIAQQLTSGLTAQEREQLSRRLDFFEQVELPSKRIRNPVGFIRSILQGREFSVPENWQQLKFDDREAVPNDSASFEQSREQWEAIEPSREAQERWEQICAELAACFDSHVIATWLLPLKARELSQNTLKLVVPNNLFLSWIGENASLPLANAISAVQLSCVSFYLPEGKEAALKIGSTGH